MPPKTLLALTATLAAVALPAAAANAATYCVHLAGFKCPAGSTDKFDLLQNAMLAADATADADTILIGPGVYSTDADGFDLFTDHPVTIKGSPGTVIDGAAQTDGGPALALRRGRLERVEIDLGNRADANGVYLQKGALDRVAILGTGAGTTGVSADGGALSNLNVQVPGEAVRVAFGTDPTTITTSELRGASAVWSKGTTTIGRSRLAGAVSATQGTLKVRNSLVTPTSSPTAMTVRCYPGQTSSLTVDHVTVVAGQGVAARSHCQSAGGKASLLVRNSILSGARSLERQEDAGQADAVVVNSGLLKTADAVKDLGPGHAGTIVRAGNVLGTPAFASLQTYELAAGSPLIDAGKTGLGYGIDLAGRSRPVDGNADGVARPDIGAMERRP